MFEIVGKSLSANRMFFFMDYNSHVVCRKKRAVSLSAVKVSVVFVVLTKVPKLTTLKL